MNDRPFCERFLPKNQILKIAEQASNSDPEARRRKQQQQQGGTTPPRRQQGDNPTS